MVDLNSIFAVSPIWRMSFTIWFGVFGWVEGPKREEFFSRIPVKNVLASIPLEFWERV